MSTSDQALMNKIRRLPPRRLAEVEDFVDFLHARDDEQRLVRASGKAAEASLSSVWDNDEDAAYDQI